MRAGKRRCASCAMPFGLRGLIPESPTAGESSWPSELNPARVKEISWMRLHKSKLSCSYAGHGNHVNDVGCVQSNEPFGFGRALGYYEVTITNGGQGKCKVAVGLATGEFSMSKHPGWEPNSYGYHGETGHKIANALSSSGSNGGDAYGPTYGMGDVIGCGILFRTREVFFTRNGSHLGMAFKVNPAAAAAAAYSSTAARVGGGSAAGASAAAAAAESRGMSLFPTIGLHAKHEEVSVNFGASPFTFDIQAYEEDALAEFEAAVSSCEIPPLPLMNMVRQHLAFTGMHTTLQALDKQGSGLFGTDAVTDALAASANTRAMATSAIINGNCDSIMQFLKDLPPCCSAMVAVAVARFTQAYAAQPPLAPAQLLELAQSLFSPIIDGELKEEDAALVTTCIGLLAYPDPAAAPHDMQLLLQPEFKRHTASLVNVALIHSTHSGGSAPLLSASPITEALAATLALQKVHLDACGGRGLVFEFGVQNEAQLQMQQLRRQELQQQRQQRSGFSDDASQTHEEQRLLEVEMGGFPEID